MAEAAIRLTGTTRTATRATLRQGIPSPTAPIIRSIPPGATIGVAAIVPGEPVDGNPLWFHTGDQQFLWSGACGSLEPLATETTAKPLQRPVVPPVVDLFHHNKVTRFADARAAGVIGVIHKASTGASGRDPLYTERRKAAQVAGLLWGAYHWGTAQPARAQIDNFLAAAQPDDRTLVALDYELDPGNQMTLEGAREFLALLGERLGRRPVLYSGHLIKDQLGERIDSFFGAHRLWLAQYADLPSVQASWATYWLWQYSDGPSRIPGIPGDDARQVDRSSFAGSAEQLAAQWAV